ncbi:MAG TPA: hypothetical protein PLU30_12640 [Verrucomicrobiae bacterium]|nr:hypothetical protein [Verrucomicrobiae bacterium]
MRVWLRKIKTVAGIVLCCSVLLPVSRCSRAQQRQVASNMETAVMMACCLAGGTRSERARTEDTGSQVGSAGLASNDVGGAADAAGESPPVIAVGASGASVGHSSLKEWLFPWGDDYYTYTYPFERFGSDREGILTTLAYIWPVVVLLLGWWFGGCRFGWLLDILALLLCAETCLAVVVLYMFSDLAIGACVAFAAAGAYACACLTGLIAGMVAAIRRRLSSRRSILFLGISGS